MIALIWLTIQITNMITNIRKIMNITRITIIGMIRTTNKYNMISNIISNIVIFMDCLVITHFLFGNTPNVLVD